MKTIITFSLLITASIVGAQTLPEVRSEFHSVVLNPDDSRDFHDYLSDVKTPTTTIRAYQAVSEALLAQVVWNPFNKLSQVIKYDKLMEEIVNEDPDNIEIRFLRLAIEYNLPSFLGMSTHVEEDTQMIIQNMSSIGEMQIEKSYSSYIFHFLSETNLISQDEISMMQQRFTVN
ncbi:hypothetical protein [Ekhidna sp.]|uniref:hypothetical protein n=1 Tax=Ekhidna sp. TaxID=2608089 RepID=UPI003296DD2A